MVSREVSDRLLVITDQASVNCKLELKYAQQCGVEIVPVVMEGSGWRASGWLGIITAGALWTRLSEESQFEDNIRQLHGQIQEVLGATVEIEEVSDEGTASPSEVAGELARLREDLDANAESQKAGATVLADPSQPATMPAGVPKLPPKFQTTEQIEELTRLVVSTSASDMSMSCVGFWGMGGIGKTVTGAAIVRNEDVRLHFHAIIWLPLGQTPLISKLQNLCHMQCTGKELSPELSSEEKKEALQQAMSGKRVLLCLDDLWEEEHELELNFADVSAGSKVLISTRTRALLDGGHQVEVGLPSPSDSARMFLLAADADSSTAQPAGVSEIVDLCGRLPLALGIAGRLAASLGFVGTQDWSDMIGVLKEELRESHSGGAEEGMIRASLRGLKGSATEQANVKSLLLLFGLVPEDTHCPLEVLFLMFNAVHTDVSATLMHIRKWLRVLINRSLVLGTIDRPSLHDLVLDFAVAQHSDEALCDQHRCIVEAFRAARPVDARGRHKYDATSIGDPLTTYVCSEGGHHVSASSARNELPIVEWLQDMPQDELVLMSARVVGLDKLSDMAGRAEDARDWWLAGRYWSLVREVAFHLGGHAASLDPAHRSLDALLHVTEESAPGRGVLRLLSASRLTLANPVAAEYTARFSEIQDILAAPAAASEPTMRGGALMINAFLSAMRGDSDVLKVGQMHCAVNAGLRDAASSEPDPQERLKCQLMLAAFGGSFTEVMLLANPNSWEDFCGADGELFIRGVRKYEYSRWHMWLLQNANGDWFAEAISLQPLVLHWGDIVTAEEFTDRAFETLRRIFEEPNQAANIMTQYSGLAIWAPFLHSTGLTYGRDKLAALMVDAGLTYTTAEATIAGYEIPWMRPLGDKTQGGYFGPTERMVWTARLGYVLIAGDPGASREEILADLPSVEKIIEVLMNLPTMSNCHAVMGAPYNVFFTAAAVCEKYEAYEQALPYLDAALSTDLTKAGTTLPISRAQSSVLKGRVLAALGRTAEAGSVLEGAAEEAHRYGIRLHEAFALRDLKLCVLDGMGHGDHGSRRLGAVLRLLKGPADKLTPLLNGLNVAELMSLPPPDASYHMVYKTAEDSATATLRKELDGLRLKDLRKKAKELGVDEDTLEDALDSDAPKAALIALILDASEAAGDAASLHAQKSAAMLSELQGLRPKELRKRARDVGINAELLEDAIDADDPKSAVIELLMAKSSDAGEEAALRTGFEGLRLKELRRRAKDAGVDADELEDATDSDDPKATVIQLLLAQRLSSSKAAAGDRPPAPVTPLLDGLDAGELMGMAPPDATYTVVYESEDPAVRKLRSELSAMKLSALRKRASGAGIDDDAMEAAADGDDEKDDLLGLLLANGGGNDGLRAELSSMKLSALRRRAAADSVGEEAMEEAADGGDETSALVQLILSCQTSSRPVKAIARAAPVRVRASAKKLAPTSPTTPQVRLCVRPSDSFAESRDVHVSATVDTVAALLKAVGKAVGANVIEVLIWDDDFEEFAAPADPIGDVVKDGLKVKLTVG